MQNSAAHSVPPSPGRGGSASAASRGGVKRNTNTEFAATLSPHPARLRCASAGDPPLPGEGGSPLHGRFFKCDSPAPQGGGSTPRLPLGHSRKLVQVRTSVTARRNCSA